jgi:WD40 repeat protein
VDTHGGMNAGCGQYFTPQNELLAVVYDTGVLFSYDKKTEQLCSKKPDGATLVYYFEAPHQEYFVLGDGKVWSWDFLSAEIANIRSGAPYPFPNDVFLAADQDSGWYAYVSNGQLLIENVSSRIHGTTIDNQDDYHYRVAFLPNQKLLALGSQYGSIHIWTMP